MKWSEVSLTEVEKSDEEIFSDRDFRVFVLGLPRSGTSMMSGIVERLGVNFYHNTDTKENKKKRKKQERVRYGDDGYVMNEDFYEVSNDRLNYFLNILSTPYSGMKLILPLRGMLSSLLKAAPCRVIQMWRDVEEVRQSQQASYKGDLIIPEEIAQQQRDMLEAHLCDNKVLMENLNIPTIHVRYRDVLENPEEKIQKIADFINTPNDISDAVNWVDPNKNRFKEECLIPNI